MIRDRSGRLAAVFLAAAGAALLPSGTFAQAGPVASAPRPDAAAPGALNPDSFRLWPGRAPRASSDSVAETPVLTVFRPPAIRANGTAVVIAPGGAYVELAMGHEGLEPAAWFTSRGITAFVLAYRVGSTAPVPTPLLDGARAIRFVRANAAGFGIDPARIGMLGFSAGGHLAATTATGGNARVDGQRDAIDAVSSRPDFLVLGYPWIEGFRPGNGGLEYCQVMARIKQPCNAQDLSTWLPTSAISGNTPPTFIFHTTDDPVVPVGGVLRFYEALVASKVPAELHVFGTGPHGVGFGGPDPSLSRWPGLLETWLRQRGLLAAGGS